MNSQTWNNLVREYAPPFGAFLQSWEWGEFQKNVGRTVERVHVPGTDAEAVAQAILMPLPLGQSYWYIPKGPLGYGQADTLVERVREVLPSAVFLRCEPTQETRFMKVHDVQPAHTVMVDLTVGEEKLIANFKSKTRYNFRLAQKKGVVCKFVGLEAFPDFMRLMEQTAARDNFSAHHEKYYHQMLESLQAGEATAKLPLAYFEDRPITANIIVDFNGVRTYLHGATSNLHRDVMAQYALHVFLMTDAIAVGLKAFDFWGIAPADAPADHPWAGITRYKLGFGGLVYSMPGTIDLPLRHTWYGLYRMMKNLRRK